MSQTHKYAYIDKGATRHALAIDGIDSRQLIQDVEVDISVAIYEEGEMEQLAAAGELGNVDGHKGGGEVISSVVEWTELKEKIDALFAKYPEEVAAGRWHCDT